MSALHRKCNCTACTGSETVETTRTVLVMQFTCGDRKNAETNSLFQWWASRCGRSITRRTWVWKLDNFYDIPWVYHRLSSCSLFNWPGFTLWYRPPPRTDYARPGLKGCADVSCGKRPIYLVGGFNSFFLKGWLVEMTIVIVTKKKDGLKPPFRVFWTNK